MFDLHLDIHIFLFRLNLIECELPNEKATVCSERFPFLFRSISTLSMKSYPRRDEKQKFQSELQEMVEFRFILISLLDSILFEVEHGVRISKGKAAMISNTHVDLISFLDRNLSKRALTYED